VWLQKGNDMSKILVVSSHAKETYMNTKAKAVVQHSQETIDYSLQTPVEVVWETTPRAEPEDIPGFTLDCDHNFLIVSQQGPRKNFLNAVTWWVEEFIDQEVGLIVKTNIASNSITDWQILEREFSKILAKYKDRKCKVYLLHGDLSAGQMTSLYTNSKIKAMINISHGEGFGLPLFEAAREAMPIITIGWSGQLDFLHHEGKNYFQEVEYTLQQIQKEAVWDGVLQADAKWAFANQGSYKMTLRKTLRNWSKCKETALELAALINDKFNEEKLFSGFCDAIYKEDPELLEWMQELEALDED
jgi:hypothetical protein